MKMDFPDEYLEKMWNTIDWTAAEEKLAALQADLSHAAVRNNRSQIEKIQKNCKRHRY